MVTANSVKFSSVTYKIFPSNTGEPSRSTFDAQSLLFGLRSRHDCGNTTISFVLLCVGTIWAVKHRTKVHYYAKTSRLPSNRSSDTYDLFWCLSSTPRNHVTWRHFWNGSIPANEKEISSNWIILSRCWIGWTKHPTLSSRNRTRKISSLLFSFYWLCFYFVDYGVTLRP